MMCAEPNVYFRRWFEFFHIGVDEARTMQETMFICRCAPLPNFRKVLDACCGTGWHARALSSQGYSVIGIDRDADVIAKARTLAGGPGYENADSRLPIPVWRVRSCDRYVSKLWLFRCNNKSRCG
jgi:SAM-dependent methyltransferase